ncbi:hypothetical protein BDR03DRAFT_950638 [Suillus americanus]|nr:hypothetical protein BDR03DRAFT_950638 [Suillus americanus]
MADERTVSTITWLNSPTRSRQDISTLKEHIQIRQWHRWQADVSKEPTVAPSIKWRDMYATIHSKPETPPVVPPPTRPPIVTVDVISSLTSEHQGRCSDSDDEDGDWRDSADHVGLAPRYSVRPPCTANSCSWRSVDAKGDGQDFVLDTNG